MVLSVAIGSGVGLMPTSTVSVMVAVPPVQSVYVIAAVYVVVTEGATVTVSPVPTDVVPSNHSIANSGSPNEGVNLQNSSVASQTPVFLPGGVNATVPGTF